jgi:glycosyltransferase involved in cell wall biosynthesis
VKPQTNAGDSILMIAYTNYHTDPRVIREAEAAVSAGFDVDFIALRRANDAAVEMVRGVRLIHLAQSRYRGGGLPQYMAAYLVFFARCLFKAAFLSLKKRYRTVYVHNMPDFLVFCAFIPKLLGAKVVLDIHDPMPNTFAAKFKGGEKGFYFKLLLWQELLSARYADRVVTVHELIKDRVLVKHGLLADTIQVVPNFADDKVFCLQPSYSPNGKVKMVFHGTILERYGLRTLLEALSMVQNRDKISVRIIGEGDFSQRFAGLIKSLNLDEMVEFENRVYPFQEIPGLLAGCHLGLVPLEVTSITNYALSLKMMEYISMGVPVVTVRNAAVAHYFGENDCLFYKPGDAKSLSSVLDRVAEDRDLLLGYHRKTLELREKFLWSKEKQKYIELLEGLAKVGRNGVLAAN